MDPLLGGESRKSGSGIGKISCFFTLLAIVAFVVALSTPALISTQGFGDLSTSKLGTDFGPFRLCWHAGDSNGCEAINSECKFTATIIPDVGLGAITHDFKVVDNCDSWNAGRGLLVIATIAACLAFLSQLVVAASGSGGVILRSFAVVFGVVAALCGMISMALFIQLRGHDDTFQAANSADFMYGFYFIIVGFVLSFLASVPFCVSK